MWDYFLHVLFNCKLCSKLYDDFLRIVVIQYTHRCIWKNPRHFNIINFICQNTSMCDIYEYKREFLDKITKIWKNILIRILKCTFRDLEMLDGTFGQIWYQHPVENFILWSFGYGDCIIRQTVSTTIILESCVTNRIWS